MRKKALVLIAFGGAKDASVPSAKKFLAELLCDKEVLSLPKIVRHILAYYIARRRCEFYSNALKEILINGVSPIYHYAESIREKLSEKLSEEVFLAYRYGEKNITSTIAEAKDKGVDNFIFLPLFPQKASSTTVSCINEVCKSVENPNIRRSYFRNDIYLNSLAEKILMHTKNIKNILVSFHSIPRKHNEKFDYEKECERTLSALQCRLPKKILHIAYQSKMGRGDWLSPNITDVATKLLRENKVKELGVVAPCFFCECMETLSELDKDLRHHFLAEGGEVFEYVPCLNDDDSQILLLEYLYKNFKK